MKSFIPIAADSDFSLHNIPFGIAKHNKEHILVTRIGDAVISLNQVAQLGYFNDVSGIAILAFKNQYLNDFIALGKPVTKQVRELIQQLFSIENKAEQSKLSTCILSDYELTLPVRIGDYTDFYSSIDHATNVGKMFRDPENALLPNWKHLPVGYHGRSSSIFVSGQAVNRPQGQTKNDADAAPTFGPSKLVDFELEMGFIIGKSTNLGDSVNTSQAAEYIFGFCLFNDWSARDIQKWEYVPLGPFLAKNFFSSVSPWIVTWEALTPFHVAGYKQEPEVLPYLKDKRNTNIDIHLDVYIKTPNEQENHITKSNFKYMYWSVNQQLAHHTSNGCNINVGDMMASGTISGPHEGSYGSMLEIAWQGKKPITLADGTERRFINDNDTVIIKGYASKDDVRVGFGEVANKLLPAK